MDCIRRFVFKLIVAMLSSKLPFEFTILKMINKDKTTVEKKELLSKSYCFSCFSKREERENEHAVIRRRW